MVVTIPYTELVIRIPGKTFNATTDAKAVHFSQDRLKATIP